MSSNAVSNVLIVLLATVSFFSGAGALTPDASPTPEDASWPRRVLITNDNGIDDVRIVELARALARKTEVVVVAATTDRSGTSNYMPSARAGEFRVERRDLGEGIEAYALDGYPADCVLFAVAGPMRDHLPDLVISGINGGANLGDAWLGSGTIGAARTAAYLGFPAVAVSGVDDDDPEAVRAAVAWVVELARSPAVKTLEAPQYLTISLPPVSPEKIAGVEVVQRARGLLGGRAVLDPETSSGKNERWRLEIEFRPQDAPPDSDVATAFRGKIAVVPMRVDEADPTLRARLREQSGLLPDWKAAPAAQAP